MFEFLQFNNVYLTKLMNTSFVYRHADIIHIKICLVYGIIKVKDELLICYL